MAKIGKEEKIVPLVTTEENEELVLVDRNGDGIKNKRDKLAFLTDGKLDYNPSRVKTFLSKVGVTVEDGMSVPDLQQQFAAKLHAKAWSAGTTPTPASPPTLTANESLVNAMLTQQLFSEAARTIQEAVAGSLVRPEAAVYLYGRVLDKMVEQAKLGKLLGNSNEDLVYLRDFAAQHKLPLNIELADLTRN